MVNELKIINLDKNKSEYFCWNGVLLSLEHQNKKKAGKEWKTWKRTK